MSPEYIPHAWIASGVFLMLLELLIPGLIVVFLGAAAVIVGLFSWLNFFDRIETAFITWIFLSILLVIVFRNFALRFFPSDSSYQLVEEDVSAIGTVVNVIQTINESSNSGRIRYNGTSWPAVSHRGTIEAGKKARLLYRDNISWVVEPDDSE